MSRAAAWTIVTAACFALADSAPIWAADGAGALDSLARWIAEPVDKRPSLAAADFAAVPLSRAEADKAAALLVEDHARQIKATRAKEMEEKRIVLGKHEMKFWYQVFGDKPAAGRSLFISLHGGGGAPARVNDGQWQNQKRLYQPAEGVYLCPRAPTDTWNLWHQAHIDDFFARLIENLVVFESVNPDRVYVLGYSAGGDGVYQLAPRMADRWAAAAMMAGHPNDASPLGLRNLPFTLHVGGKDAAYRRNEVAAQWRDKLAALRKDDPQGYLHDVQIHEQKGHWMDREDAVAIPWMAKQTRNPLPDKIVWQQDDVTHRRFYWLAVDEPKAKTKITATRQGQQLDLTAENVPQITVRLNDQLVNLDQEVTIKLNGAPAYQGRPPRTLRTLATTLQNHGDPKTLFPAEVKITAPVAK